MFDPASVRFRGPLTAHADGFWAELQRQSYTPFSARNLLLLAAHFSRWLDDRRWGLADLSAEGVASFLAHRRRQGYTSFRSPRGLGPLLGYLRGIGVVVRPAPVIETSTDALLREYAQYLARERSLCAGTISQYVHSARQFAAERFGPEEPRWSQLTASEVTTFVMQQSRRLSVGYCKHKISDLRSFLRFLHVRGHITSSLAECLPAVAGWRLASVPKALEPDQVDRLLAQVAPSSAIHRRDAAIVRLQLRLGLRAGDVAALELDDLDWRAGEMVVRGKGKRESRLPLPDDVGKATAAYLRRRRPPALTRKVFLRSRAPYDGLSPGGVISATRSVLRRAGITAGGAHLLRHTAATQMLRKGASLSEIAHVLRHRHIDTTAIYAKVDHTSLRLVARPWPESAL
ncbi:MAG TPA: site-specific integrase [Vicinamibacteria bacterium]|jgi:site-specific recombinase XerD